LVDLISDFDLVASPAWFPFAMDQRADVVLFMNLTEADYEAASFLDKRMLRPGATGVWKPWHEVSQAAAGLPERSHFIFHISHVGSTLLSRLLGQHTNLFSLREPMILRSLAEVHLGLDQPGCCWSRSEFGDRLGVFVSLLSRTFEPRQTAIIKATSFVSEMAQLFLERVMTSRAIFMFVSPLTFLKSLLDGAMSDITDQADRRLRRLHRRLGAAPWEVDKLSAGECVAMSWLSEMFALHTAGALFRDRILWIDFDRFLEAPNRGLAAALRHFKATDSQEATEKILSGPDMLRYAKAPAYSFDTQKRAQLLQQSEQRHASEIRKGLDWLDRAQAANSLVREVLEANTFQEI
jgi:hypothetical protein